MAENPYQREHDDLIASIRGTGPHRFDADYGATSSMTAVMGRMATYSGQLVTWDEADQVRVATRPGTLRLGRRPADQSRRQRRLRRRRPRRNAGLVTAKFERVNSRQPESDSKGTSMTRYCVHSARGHE